MRTKTIALVAALLAAVLLLVTPLGAQAAKLITGKQIKDSSLTGKDVKDNSLTGKDIAEGTLGTVPSAKKATTATSADSADTAASLAPLGPGETQSGAFGAASGTSAGTSGYLGFAITFPRPLTAPISSDHVVDTQANPDPVNCPGPGEAAPGYLCLYPYNYSAIDPIYGYTNDGPYAATGGLWFGVGLYAPINDLEPFVDGIWTVTAPTGL